MRPKTASSAGRVKHFIPRDATVDELEQKAAVCEQQASAEQEPRAADLRDKAELYREWRLRFGKGTGHRSCVRSSPPSL